MLLPEEYAKRKPAGQGKYSEMFCLCQENMVMRLYANIKYGIEIDAQIQYADFNAQVSSLNRIYSKYY